MDSETALRHLLWYSSEYGNKVLYIQEFVDHGFSDIRAFVVGDQVIAAMKQYLPGDATLFLLAYELDVTIARLWEKLDSGIWKGE
jgi:hypothetical protein